MSEDSKYKAEERALDAIRKHNRIEAKEVLSKLLLGDRFALAQAITWVESTQNLHKEMANEIIRGCLPVSGNSIRIGITGVPGVGKSTFINVFGEYLVQIGRKVAVLTVDPSSQISGGSILGDKTRMDQLSNNADAFIRPSSSSNVLGGVARKTRETILLCEAAGYNIILIETVGVGQSETTVHGMSDFFLLLMLTGAGDQLQGIKRGIMELCDGMLITKADGSNSQNAQNAQSEFMMALHLFPPTESNWIPPVQVCSATEKIGIDDAWKMIEKHDKWMKERDFFHQKRNRQDELWLNETIQQKLNDSFFSNKERMDAIENLKNQMRLKEITPFEAAELLFKMI